MTLSNSPRLIKGGLLTLDTGSGVLLRSIAFQYNPDSLSISYQVQGVGGDGGGERAQPFRLKGPAVQTIKLDAEVDATDALEHPDQNRNAARFGVAPQLAALEAMINPTVADLLTLKSELASGTLEILPAEAPLTVFVFSASRIVPVRVTEFSITEEAFDPALNPTRAKVSLGLRVMSTDDLGFEHRGASMFLNHLRVRESLASKINAAPVQALGLTRVPT